MHRSIFVSFFGVGFGYRVPSVLIRQMDASDCNIPISNNLGEKNPGLTFMFLDSLASKRRFQLIVRYYFRKRFGVAFSSRLFDSEWKVKSVKSGVTNRIENNQKDNGSRDRVPKQLSK